jgi:hypothetical protein
MTSLPQIASRLAPKAADGIVHLTLTLAKAAKTAFTCAGFEAKRATAGETTVQRHPGAEWTGSCWP